MIKIAVDGMGSDNAPESEVDGSIQAVREYDVSILLVGKEDILTPLVRARGGAGLPIEIRHASQTVGMDEKPTSALRRKRDSSLRVAADQVREGLAQGLVSAGNTGAVMAISKTVLGVVPGVDRPALATVVPTLLGHAVLLDVGANISCKAHHLIQFAIMGHLFSQTVLGVKNPKVGLLSVGEEESKGTDLTKGVHQALKHAHLHFIGNVEGRDIYSGKADVIVSDGFTGNVALKTSEGLIEAILKLLKEELSSTLLAKFGALLSRPAFHRIKRRLDYAEYGGAPLIGLRGISIICHGRSNAVAIKNAVRVAKEFAEKKVNPKLELELSQIEEYVGAMGL